MLVTQSCPPLCDPMDYSLPGSSVHGIFQEEYWSGLPFLSPRDLPDPGIELTSLVSPALAVGSLPLAPPGKPPFCFVLFFLEAPLLAAIQSNICPFPLSHSFATYCSISHNDTVTVNCGQFPYSDVPVMCTRVT